MRRRPFLVTVVAWVAIVAACSGLFRSFAFFHAAGLHTEIRPSADALGPEVFFYLFKVLAILGGIFLIEGVVWAPVFFLSVGFVSIVYQMLNLHGLTPLVTPGIIYLASAAVLYSSRSRRYFQRHTKPAWR